MREMENMQEQEVLETTEEVVEEAAATETNDASEPETTNTEETEAKLAGSAPVKQKGRKIPYERRKALYGYGFIALWAIGTIYFFIMPLIESFIYSFNKTQPVDGEMQLEWVGLKNYIDAFRTDVDYSPALVNMLKDTALKTPLILVFSIFIAVILNQKFKGRTFARAVFFLPVIIATGPVIDIINGNMSTGGYAGGSEQFSSMFEANLVDELLNFLGVYNISDSLTEAISSVTSDIMNLVWNSGIQVLLFLSALQGIPTSAKEAANMEGATAWEYFWKITIPYISPMILASIVYTVVDSFVDPSNDVMLLVLTKSSSWEHGMMAAMAWAYFAIVGVVLGIVVIIVNKIVYYEVEEGGGVNWQLKRKKNSLKKSVKRQEKNV